MATARARPGGQVLHSSTGASEQIAAQLRVWLEQQQLKTGERIGTEQELADEFGVSRPTMREALRLLSAAHLIRVGRGRAGGIFVARTPSEGMSRNLSESIALMLSAQTISMNELLDARLSLEVPIAGRAAVNGDDEVVARLEQAIADAEGHQPGSEAWNTADGRFHATLAEASGNQLLHALTGWILEVLQPSLIVTISAARRRRGDPRPAPRDPPRRAAAPAPGGGEGDGRPHRVPGPDPRRGRVTLVGFLGLGEAGSLIAADLAAAGVTVRGWDPLVPESPGVETTAGPAEVAEGADIVVSVNSAHDALDAARSVLDTLRPGQLYADFNTAAPGRKKEVAAVIEPTGAAFADVALLQSVPGRGLRTPAMASGAGAARFAEHFGAWGMPVEVGTDEPGYAASRKLARSVFLKGLAAAAGEALATGEALGCEEWLRDDLSRWLADADAAAFEHLVEGSRKHAVRRRAEMEAAVAMLEELGVTPRVAAASEAWLERAGGRAARVRVVRSAHDRGGDLSAGDVGRNEVVGLGRRRRRLLARRQAELPAVPPGQPRDRRRTRQRAAAEVLRPRRPRAADRREPAGRARARGR